VGRALRLVGAVRGQDVTFLLVRQLDRDRPLTLFSGIGLIVVAWVISQLFRALLLGGALGQTADKLARLEARPLSQHTLLTAQETTGYFFLSALLRLLVWSWRMLALIAGIWLYARALITGQFGLVSSGAFAPRERSPSR
jgi:hypothetical protein